MSLFFIILMILIAFLPFISYGTIRFLEYKKAKANGYLDKTNLRFRDMIKDKGAYGEFLTYCILNKVAQKDEIFINTYIPVNNKTTEIDLILLNKTGIYVFESKNYSGWIFGKDDDYKWTVSLQNSKKYQFLNPVKQNEFHIKALKELLNLNDNYFKSIVVFSERCELKKIKSKVPVIKRNFLLKEISKTIKGNEEIFTKDELNNIKNILNKYSNVSNEVKKTHIKNLKSG